MSAAGDGSGLAAAEGAGGWEARALVVDGDAVSRRFAELTLAGAGFHVEAAGSGAAALEVLAAAPIHLLLVDSELSDLNGLALVRRLRKERRLRDIPVVLLTSDRRQALRIAALQTGVEDVLGKPCDPAELAARCQAIVRRHRRLREAQRRRGFTLAGDFTGLAFGDLVALLGGGRRSGVLALASPEAAGEIHFRDGQVTAASYGNLLGADAFHRYLAAENAVFEFSPGAATAADGPAEPAMALLMEGARRLDTARRDFGVPPAPRGAAAPSPPGDAAPPLAPDARLARRFQAALRDPFALGELKLLTPGDLAAWTRSELGQSRFHVHLVADPADGAGALLPLAGSLSERLLLDALAPGPKSLGVAYFLRDERTIDVLLVDATDLSIATPAVRRTPALVLVAPPQGDLLALGTRGRTTLFAHLRTLRPAVVLGCGRPALEAALARLCAAACPGAAVGFHQGELGRDGSTLRDLLLHGLERWGAGAPAVDATVAAP